MEYLQCNDGDVTEKRPASAMQLVKCLLGFPSHPSRPADV